MKHTLILLGCLMIAALIAAVHFAPSLSSLSSLRSLRRSLGLHAGILRVNALTDGIHATGKITLRADAALATRYLIVKRGSDADHVAVCGVADKPLGVCLDEPSAAEEPATIGLLGGLHGTILGVASEAIAADADVFTAANGKLQDEPAVAGTYYLIGKSVTAATGDGDVFEMIPRVPVKFVVIANASTLVQTQTAMNTAALVKVL
jgi:hypothetical protein